MLHRGAIAWAVAMFFMVAWHAGVASADDFTNREEFASAGACPLSTAVADDATRSRAMSAVLCLVNSERALRGLRAVRMSSQLTRSAEGHSFDMTRRKYFSHVSPEGSDMRRRVARSGYIKRSRRGLLGETIAWGTQADGTPAELMRAFMNSPGHRRIILDGRYRDVGVGLALAAPVSDMPGPGATLTLDFGRR